MIRLIAGVNCMMMYWAIMLIGVEDLLTIRKWVMDKIQLLETNLLSLLQENIFDSDSIR